MATVRALVLSNTFKKAYQKFTGKNRSLQFSIDNTLLKLQEDAYNPLLRTHKLSGKLAAYLACSCGYDCRIVFSIEKYQDQTEYLLLIDIGTHDDVY
jgi:mRNA-degrading endonuclease YafQ of YafQ-DinJ toxin-antitoxin module